MLFNSYEFIFLFLPLLILTISIIRKHEYGITICLIIFSSIFYAWWDIKYLLLMYFSIAVNYCIGKALFQFKAKMMLIIGISFNLLLLIIFKYSMLLINSSNQLFNLSFTIPHIILPLAISFYTFQQIAFLSDTYTGKLDEYPKPTVYCLFVIFFPQLIAGPIVHWKQVLHQYTNISKRLSWENLYIGILIFTIGLFKKVIIADTFAVHADNIFSVSDFSALTSHDAWAGTLCFGLQIYFDFSAYADMAIGLARMFGIELPINFMSPYKSRSIIEFWRRWHISLSRFLRDYLYVPLGGNRINWHRQMGNIMITMLIGGIWHGASWAFLMWGGIHGVFIVINHSWRKITQGSFKNITQTRLFSCISLLLTLLVVFLAWVPFRVNDPQQFLIIWTKILSFNDLLLLPEHYAEKLGSLSAAFESFGFQFVSREHFPITRIFAYCLLGFIAVLVLPNTAELFRPYLSGINQSNLKLYRYKFDNLVYTSPSVIFIAALTLVVCTLFLFRVIKFIYFQF